MATILVADDDQQLLDLYQMKLTKAGFTVVLVSDGKEIINQAKAAKPAAILLDRRLGNADGMEIFKQLREIEETKNTPILLMSNQDPTGEEVALIKSLGHGEYVVKEKIDLNELVTKIKNILSIS